MHNLVTNNKKSEHFSDSQRVTGFKQRRMEFGFQDFVLATDLAWRTPGPPLLVGIQSGPVSLPCCPVPKH